MTSATAHYLCLPGAHGVYYPIMCSACTFDDWRNRQTKENRPVQWDSTDPPIVWWEGKRYQRVPT